MLPKALCCSVHIVTSLTREKYTKNDTVFIPLENETDQFLGACLYVIIYCAFLEYLLSYTHNLIEGYLNVRVKPCLSFPEH